MSALRIDYPGLLRERLPSGNFRYRVRVEGNKKRRIALPVTPDHPDFANHYWAARGGEKLALDDTGKIEPAQNSLDWLTRLYLIDLEERVKAGTASPLTLKQRKGQLARLCNMTDADDDRFGTCNCNLPKEWCYSVLDKMHNTPGAADNMMKTVRAVYKWAVSRGHANANPAIGIEKVHKGGGGATPWTINDLKAYRTAHPQGTAAHLCLTLFMFTACRISDAITLGRKDEIIRDGVLWLAWQPAKKGASFVEIPMLPPLRKAVRSAKVIGATYNLTEHGKPFKSPEGLRNRFRKWCDVAGLQGLSSHGIRKAAGELLAEAGCSQHEIMAIHGHTNARTSEIYTKGVNRRALAHEAMKKLKHMEW
jgi:integrase